MDPAVLGSSPPPFLAIRKTDLVVPPSPFFFFCLHSSIFVRIFGNKKGVQVLPRPGDIVRHVDGERAEE